MPKKAKLNQYKLGKPYCNTETEIISLDIRGVPESAELLRDLTYFHFVPQKWEHLPVEYVVINDAPLSRKASLAILRGYIFRAEKPYPDGKCRYPAALSFAYMALPDDDEVLGVVRRLLKSVFSRDSYCAPDGTFLRQPEVTCVCFNYAVMGDDVFTLLMSGLEDEYNMLKFSINNFHLTEDKQHDLIGAFDSCAYRPNKPLKEWQMERQRQGYPNFQAAYWKRNLILSFENLTFDDPNGARDLFAVLGKFFYIYDASFDGIDCSGVTEEDMKKVIGALCSTPPRTDGIKFVPPRPHFKGSFNDTSLTEPLTRIVAAGQAKSINSSMELKGCVTTNHIVTLLFEAAANCLYYDQINVDDPNLQKMLRNHCKNIGQAKMATDPSVKMARQFVSTFREVNATRLFRLGDDYRPLDEFSSEQEEEEQEEEEQEDPATPNAPTQTVLPISHARNISSASTATQNTVGGLSLYRDDTRTDSVRSSFSDITVTEEDSGDESKC